MFKFVDQFLDRIESISITYTNVAGSDNKISTTFVYLKSEIDWLVAHLKWANSFKKSLWQKIW
ncbi:MAG: hypothetical protein CMF36_16400 [Leeuwenhoekiella sp.]|nr:hypothetical protein [Leeuwenhoekiella sp.]MBA82711.1 hypothetical protein [Leeuwenhoekiella sp.]